MSRKGKDGGRFGPVTDVEMMLADLRSQCAHLRMELGEAHGLLARVDEGAKDDRAALVALGSVAAELRTAVNDLRCSTAGIGGAVNECVTLLRGARAGMEADRAAPVAYLPATQQAEAQRATGDGDQQWGVVLFNGARCHVRPCRISGEAGYWEAGYWADTPWGRAWFSVDVVDYLRHAEGEAPPAAPSLTGDARAVVQDGFRDGARKILDDFKAKYPTPVTTVKYADEGQVPKPATKRRSAKVAKPEASAPVADDEPAPVVLTDGTVRKVRRVTTRWGTYRYCVEQPVGFSVSMSDEELAAYRRLHAAPVDGLSERGA